MLGKFIAGDFIAIAGEMRRFPASNENTANCVINPYFHLSLSSRVICIICIVEFVVDGKKKKKKTRSAHKNKFVIPSSTGHNLTPAKIKLLLDQF